jgi:dihydrofolate synthase/folylpolyglutamate synthase
LESSIYGSKFDFSSNSSPYENLELKLAGSHQVMNAVTTLTALQKLRQLGWAVKEDALRWGLKKTEWRARLEIYQKEPLVLLDVAHNSPGMKALIDSLDELLPGKQIVFVFGVMEDKDHRSMLTELAKKARFVFLTKPDYKRSAEPDSLKPIAERLGIPCQIVPQVKPAYLSALDMAKPDDVICVTGSHFTVGELLDSLES